MSQSGTNPASLDAAHSALVFNCATPLGEAVANEFLDKGFKVVACVDFADGAAAASLAAKGAQVEILTPNRETEDRLVELAGGVGAVIFTNITDANLRTLAALERANPARCVFISANDAGASRHESRFSGFASAEARVSGSRLSWTILRPTLTYGHADDGNLSVLAQRLKEGRATIVPALEEQSHQPIHFQDVARAAVAIAGWADGARRVVPIGGPDKVTLPGLYDAVADAVEARKRPKHVPLGRLRLTTKAARLLHIKVPGGLSRSGRIERPRTAVTPPDMPAAARPQINLKTGLELLAKDLSRLDGTPEGAQLAGRHAPELPL